MNGELQDGGVIPRCLDVIFNSMGHIQVIGLFLSKYQQLSIISCNFCYYTFAYSQRSTFKPDRMNGIVIQSESDAQSDRPNELQLAQSSEQATKFK